ncbi:SRPBCC domain-containing protein [Blastococcus sp. SYSU DS0533]
MQGCEEHGFHGSFHEVRPDELIAQTSTYEGWPEGVALEKLRLEDLGGGRTRLVPTSLCDSSADRDAVLASGMEVRVDEGYEKLDELLARRAPGRPGVTRRRAVMRGG